MKKKSLILASVLFAAFIGCQESSKILNSKSEINKTVDIENGKFLELAISNGNGNYIVTSSDSIIATAITEAHKLKIKGLKEGEAILTITDDLNRNLRIAVIVTEQQEITDKKDDKQNSKISQKDI